MYVCKVRCCVWRFCALGKWKDLLRTVSDERRLSDHPPSSRSSSVLQPDQRQITPTWRTCRPPAPQLELHLHNFTFDHSRRAASKVEAVARSPTNMAAAKIAAVDFNKMTSKWHHSTGLLAFGHVCWGRSASQSTASNASASMLLIRIVRWIRRERCWMVLENSGIECGRK